jgi:hypothetical protein
MQSLESRATEQNRSRNTYPSCGKNSWRLELLSQKVAGSLSKMSKESHGKTTHIREKDLVGDRPESSGLLHHHFAVSPDVDGRPIHLGVFFM